MPAKRLDKLPRFGPFEPLVIAEQSAVDDGKVKIDPAVVGRLIPIKIGVGPHFFPVECER